MLDSLVEVLAIKCSKGHEYGWLEEEGFVHFEVSEPRDDKDIALVDFWAFEFTPIGVWSKCPWNGSFQMDLDQVGYDFINGNKIKEYAEKLADTDEVRFITAWKAANTGRFLDCEHECELMGLLIPETMRIEYGP